MPERISVFGQTAPTSADFDSALFYAEHFGQHAKRLLASVRWIAAGHTPGQSIERSGDEVTDEADRIAETVLALEAEHQRARLAIERCRENLSIQNDRPTEGASDPKPVFDGTPFDSAHETLLALCCSLTAAVRSWDHDPGEAVEVFRTAVNVAKLRENLSEACEWIMGQKFSLDSEAIEKLLADARWECRQAKNGASVSLPARRHVAITSEAIADASGAIFGAAPNCPTDLIWYQDIADIAGVVKKTVQTRASDWKKQTPAIKDGCSYELIKPYLIAAWPVFPADYAAMHEILVLKRSVSA